MTNSRFLSISDVGAGMKGFGFQGCAPFGPAGNVVSQGRGCVFLDGLNAGVDFSMLKKNTLSLLQQDGTLETGMSIEF